MGLQERVGHLLHLHIHTNAWSHEPIQEVGLGICRVKQRKQKTTLEENHQSWGRFSSFAKLTTNSEQKGARGSLPAALGCLGLGSWQQQLQEADGTQIQILSLSPLPPAETDCPKVAKCPGQELGQNITSFLESKLTTRAGTCRTWRRRTLKGFSWTLAWGCFTALVLYKMNMRQIRALGLGDTEAFRERLLL